MSEPLYLVTVRGPMKVGMRGGGRQELLRIVGERQNVIDAALRVMLDCGVSWQEQSQWRSNPFEVDVTKIA